MNKETLIRTITALIVAVLDLLAVFGLDIHVAQNEVLTVVSLVVGAWIWWKNNSVTKSAIISDSIMHKLKKAEANGDLTVIDDIEAILEEHE